MKIVCLSSSMNETVNKWQENLREKLEMKTYLKKAMSGKEKFSCLGLKNKSKFSLETAIHHETCLFPSVIQLPVIKGSKEPEENCFSQLSC